MSTPFSVSADRSSVAADAGSSLWARDIRTTARNSSSHGASSPLRSVANEDIYAVSPRAPLLTTELEQNALVCGEARFGQLGSGVRPITHQRPVPTPAPQRLGGADGTHSWAVVSMGSFHGAAITSQGKLYTWGLNSQGQCGVAEKDAADLRGRVTYYPAPARVKSSTTGGTYKLVACGGEHTVALGSRGVCAWGSNARGQLGLGVGAPPSAWRPVLLPSLSHTVVTQLVCGARHSLALTAQSQVLAWGANERGQLGLGDTLDRHTPALVEGLWSLPVTRLAAGDAHSLALTARGQLFAWGSNSHGQCGVVVVAPEEEQAEGHDAAFGEQADAGEERQRGAGGPGHQEEDAVRSRWGPPADLNPDVVEAWRQGMAAMGIADEMSFLAMHHTGWRGIEEAVDWLFSQDEAQVAQMLEQRQVAVAQQQQQQQQPPARAARPAPRAPAVDAEGGVVEGAHVPEDDVLSRHEALRSRLGRVGPHAAHEEDAHDPDEERDPAEDELTWRDQDPDQTGGAGRQEEPQPMLTLELADEVEETLVLAPVEVALQGVRHVGAGAGFTVAVLEHGEVFSWGTGAWGALGHGDLEDRELPTRVEALAGVPMDRVSCGQLHTLLVAKDGSIWGCGRCESGQLGYVAPSDVLHEGEGDVAPLVDSSNDVQHQQHQQQQHRQATAPMSIVPRPVRLALTAGLLEDEPAPQPPAAAPSDGSGGQGRRKGDSGSQEEGASCSEGLSDGDVVAGASSGGSGVAKGLAASLLQHASAAACSDIAELEDQGLHGGGIAAVPSPAKTIRYGHGAAVLGLATPPRAHGGSSSGGGGSGLWASRGGVGGKPGSATVVHEVVAGGCNSAVLLRRHNEAPSPDQVTLLAKLQVAVARAEALHSATGSSPQLALALRSASKGAALVLSAPGALSVALALRGPGPDSAAHVRQLQQQEQQVLANTGAQGGQNGGVPTPLPLPLDVPLLDQLYTSLINLAGLGAERPMLTAEAGQGSAMCELQRYSLQQALLRNSLTLCEDVLAHAPLLRTPERAQVLLAALHCPLLSDPASCKQLLPKLCHAVLAAPAVARRLLVRWWASYPPDLLLERLVQPMQAFITRELSAVRKLTSSIMAVIKVLARLEAANQLAGGVLPPEAFYNTLISEKMDVQDHYSAWRTTQDLGGGLPGVRPVTNTSGVQLYACEPDSEQDAAAARTPLTSPTGAISARLSAPAHPILRSRSANATRHQPSAALQPTHPALGRSTSHSASTSRHHHHASSGRPPALSTDDVQVNMQDGASGDAFLDPADSPNLDTSTPATSALGGMRMSDPGRHRSTTAALTLPPIAGSPAHAAHGASASAHSTLPLPRALWPDSLSPPRGATHAPPLPPLPQAPRATSATAANSAAPATSRPRSALPPRPAELPSPAATSHHQPSADDAAHPLHASISRSRARPASAHTAATAAGTAATTTTSASVRHISDPGSPANRPRPATAATTTAVAAPDRTSAPALSPLYQHHQQRGLQRTASATAAVPPTASAPGEAAPPAPPQQKPAQELGPFSFCTYPFLLDARAKSNLLHVEARFQMEQTVAHARMEQQLYGQHHPAAARAGAGAGAGHSGSRRAQQQGSSGARDRDGRRATSPGRAADAALRPDQQLMLQVLEKTVAPSPPSSAYGDATSPGHEQQQGSLSRSGGSTPRSGQSLSTPRLARGDSSNSRSGSGEGGRRIRGFRGLLEALLRTSGSRLGGSQGAQWEREEASRGGAVGELAHHHHHHHAHHAEPFQLPRPVDCAMPSTHSDMCIIRVRRTHLVEDAMDEITRQVRRDLFKPLRVHFIGEEGIDAGGVKKEFFALLLAELLKPEFGLMEAQPDSNTFWFPRHSVCAPHQYQLLGLVLGLAVYNRVLLDFPLPMAAYKKLLGMPVGLRELTEMCPSVGKSLKQLLEMEGPPGTIEDLLALTWAVEDQAWGVRTLHELVPGGDQIPVTEENRQAYVEAMVGHYLNDSVRWQFEAFQRGFGVICNGPVLRLFNAQELERLVCGSPTLDWAALQKNAKYEGGYTAHSPVVTWLWDIVRNELPLEEKKRFLKFFTGSDRAPIGGLGSLRCLIQRAGPDSSRLPTSHTCFNTLLLPEYLTRSRLARMLRNAINNAEGFGLE